MKFKVTTLNIGPKKIHTLFAKGAGIGTGIAWTWIGDFTAMKYLNMVKRNLKNT
jgi:hypothetical protein